METQDNAITIETTVNAPAEKVWKLWTEPEHIKKWNNASADWFTPHAENDLRTGGKFLARMSAKDGSFAFDFTGTYDDVKEHKLIKYTLSDGRKVNISFSEEANTTHIVETFEAEATNPKEVQRAGWQSILDNFKTYVEKN